MCWIPHEGVWERFQIIDVAEPFIRRGFRGMTVRGKQIYVVNSAALYYFELNLDQVTEPVVHWRKTVRRPEWELGERAAADLHHVLYSAEQNVLFVANSFMDSVDKLSLNGELLKRHYFWDISAEITDLALRRVPGVPDLVHVTLFVSIEAVSTQPWGT